MTAQLLADTLRKRGLQPTQQRVAVYRYLLAHRTHPTVDTVFQALRHEFPSMSRTTVYNTMHALKDVGLLRVVTIDSEEQHFDADVTDHGHFRCTQCGTVYDFALPPHAADFLLPRHLHTIQFDVYASGRCSDCQS